MLRSLARRLRRLTVEPVAFDPSGLDDPVAMRTEWSPAKGGGASFRTHRLIGADPERMELRPAGGAVLFYGIFLVVGLAVVVGFTLAFLSGALPAGSEGGFGLFVPLGVGLVFTVAGGRMLYSGTAPIVFDRRRGEYWRGRTAPHEAANVRSLEHYVELDRVHALQLVSEHCRSSESSYYSHELNLVLDDGSRINVVDHGDRERLRTDASALAAFLDKPVWDATTT